MPEALFSGTRVRYDVAGGGEPALLLVPGWCGNRTQFHGLVPFLAQKRRVLAMDLPGHGGSDAPPGDFGYREVVAAALAVVAASGADRVVPVTMAHGGWVGIALRRRLGPEGVPTLVFLDWLLFEPPPAFLQALDALQDPERWRSSRAQLFTIWLAAAAPNLRDTVVRTMSDYAYGMWARAGREIAAAYARERSPSAALAALDPPTRSLHLYATPADPAYLAAQQEFARTHPWFRVRRLSGKTHFPPLETPEEVAAAIDEFLESQ